ncbi:hypothetical protein CYMTET_13631 [Cymbomonas tetramitiformis]|uniref:Post-GPI attachment to proteins factor 3 n=1 Tax=Cymbomonas tetramitiformis TaxID=36881 RepID=A0AAE0LB03_9CHLO|nr:hypothetical protein CYMTET_13631 [Cymbomonas tetramitiformis]
MSLLSLTRYPTTCLPLVLFLGVITEGDASLGDRDQLYRQCLSNCKSTGCIWLQGEDFGAGGCSTICFGRNQSWILRATSWSCEDDCKYECMHRRSAQLKAHGYPVLKFHGKWPFYRVLGIQEFASAVFSLLNLVAHLVGMRRASAAVSAPNVYKHWWIIRAHSWVNINGWFWSTVFHAR